MYYDAFGYERPIFPANRRGNPNDQVDVNKRVTWATVTDLQKTLDAMKAYVDQAVAAMNDNVNGPLYPRSGE